MLEASTLLRFSPACDIWRLNSSSLCCRSSLRSSCVNGAEDRLAYCGDSAAASTASERLEGCVAVSAAAG